MEGGGGHIYFIGIFKQSLQRERKSAAAKANVEVRRQTESLYKFFYMGVNV
jgi:hypothetical protein